MAAAKRCATCGNDFISRRSDASYCSPKCRQRARRGRDDSRDTAVTDAAVRHRPARRRSLVAAVGEHSAAAAALLASLDAELAENIELRPGEELSWSAAEVAVRELLADTVDRKVDLEAVYANTEDARLRLKLSGELRLLEASVARLLKQVKTELPPAPSAKSRKASRAANTRWHGASG